MKRILFVMSTLYNGGAERSLVNLLQALPADRYEIELLLFKKEGNFLPLVPEYVNLLAVPKSLQRLYGPLRNSGLYLIPKLLSNAIVRILESNFDRQHALRWKYCYEKCIDSLPKNYDIAIGYINGDITYYVVDKINAKKKIAWVHNDYRAADYPIEFDRSYFQKLDKIVSVSQICVDVLKELFPEMNSKFHLLENIVSSKVIKEQALAFVPLEYNEKKLNFLSIGRLHEQKGFDLAIEAANILKNRGLDFNWFIIGNGPQEVLLRNLIKEKGLEHNMILLGLRENPYPYIHNCSLVIQPSRYEGKSVVIDEAKILGKPIVVTSYPTAEDQIKNLCEGYIVNMNANSLAEGIFKVCANKDLQQKLIAYLQEHEYGNEATVSKYMELFEE